MRALFSRKTFPLLVGAAFFLPTPLAAQIATLVKDINTTPEIPSAQRSFTEELIAGTLSTGIVVFPAKRAGVGYELFRTLGLPRTTGLVKDINPGPSHSMPGAFFNHAGTTYFYATTANEGRELWKTDGSLGGTVLVKDLTPGPGSSVVVIAEDGLARDLDQGTMAALGNSLYVLMHGARGLYKSDGTAAGTVLVKQLAPLQNTRSRFGGRDGTWQQLVAIGKKLFFAADDGSGKGIELWVSDGTSAGTVMVKDINPGAVGSSPDHFAAFQGNLWFRANDGTNGIELWKSDGSAAGTVMVKDIDTRAGSPSSLFSAPHSLTPLGFTKMLFSATDGTNGTELWVTDGTTAGTTVLDIRTGAGSSRPRSFTLLGNVVIFSANNGTFGTELWKSDGTKNGTVMVKDIRNATGSSTPQHIAVIGSKAYFEATAVSFNNYELWETDGTTNGTRMLKEVFPGAGPSSFTGPQMITKTLGGFMFFTDNGKQGSELWSSDGTTKGTALLEDINPPNPLATQGSFPSAQIVHGGTFYARVRDNLTGSALWKSDGTEAGTVRLKDAGVGKFFNPYNFTTVNGTVFFGANDVGVSGSELWKTDGTAAGTVMVKDINPGAGTGAGGCCPKWTALQGLLIFSGDDGVNGTEIWKTDGTAAGTVMIKDIAPGAASGL